MPDHYCFLCASDEGVFLDVTADNQSVFGDQLETCLTTKITENIELSNKVCYKCAYELDQCTKFVKKYKDSHETSNSKAPAAPSSCCLCLEFADSSRIFDITKDSRAIFSPLQKIRNIFNEDLTKTDAKLICLTCRYNLDVLYDLKKIYQETIINLKALINKEIDYSSFPKVHTDVVNRKTTVTTFPDITFYGSLSSDSEGENMSRRKSRVKSRNAPRGNAQKKLKGAKAKVRTCDQCRNVVATGSDMYRFHRTGLTVCKSCWITMDPNRSKGRRRSLKNTKTKLCTVFLTDVLSEGSHEKPYKLEEDEDGNKLYVILDDSSEDRSSVSSRQSASPKSQNHTATAASASKKRGKKRRIDIKSDIETTPVKMTRSSTQTSTTIPETRLTRSKTISDKEQSPNMPVTRRGRKRASTASSDSDVAQLTSKETRARTSNDRAKPASPVLRASITSPAENTKKSNRKRLRSFTLDGAALSEHSDDSSNENSRSRKKSNASSTWATPTVKPEVEIKREIRNRTRSSSISSTEMPLAEFKSPESVEVKAEYTCDKCSQKFDNKILSVEHRLTHLKQITLKLERVNVDSEKQETKEDETSKEVKSPCSRTVSIDKQGDDPSEEIAINVEDDTDDEEIFSLLKNEIKTEEQVKMAKHDESEKSEKADASDKLDTAEDESQRTEEESTKTQSDKDVSVEESEQREESMTPDKSTTLDKSTSPDKSLTPDTPVTPDKIQEKDTKDKDEKDQDIKTPIDGATDTSKDKDVKEKATVASADQDAEECETVQAEDEAEVLTEKKEEQPVSECNNDTEKVQEATTHNEETVVESLVNNAPKDQDENCTNESENNSRDNKDEEVQDVETTQDNLTNESQKESNNDKDEEESEKKNKTTTDITSKTKVPNDKKHSDDLTIIDEIGVTASEQQQNGDNLIAEMLADKPNGIGDEPDLSNCDKLDGTANDVQDDVQDDDDILMVPLANNNDVAKAKKLTDEALLKDDPPEENYKLEDGIKSLERLIKETVVSEGEYGEQENSNHVTSNNSPADAANEILSEVFNLAAAEVQKREDNKITKDLDDTEIETLENISREIRNSADMPSLDPISMMELDDDDNHDDITLD